MTGLTHRVVFLATGLALMVILHVLVVIWALFRPRPSHRVAEHAEEGGGHGGGAGLSVEEVGELPSHECEEGASGGECAVCLEPFRASDRCRVLPRCGHGFHAKCVGSWLRKSRWCPICRADVVERRNDTAGAVVEAAATVEIVAER